MVSEMSNNDGTPRLLSSDTASLLDRVELGVLGSAKIATTIYVCVCVCVCVRVVFKLILL